MGGFIIVVKGGGEMSRWKKVSAVCLALDIQEVNHLILLKKVIRTIMNFGKIKRTNALLILEV